MLAAGKWAIAIIPCGIALGALLGSAANPDMKDPPAQWWQLAGQQEFAVSDQVWIEAGPEDLNPGGYRPDLDYDALAWDVPNAEYELAAFGEEPPAARPDDLPTVTYGIAEAVDAGDEAQAVADEAAAAQAAQPDAEVRKSELVVAGLY